MRLFALTFAAILFAAPAAFACSCAPDDSAAAQQILSNPSYSVADVTVRGFNTHNGQSMLQINSIRHGNLMARDIRAKFDSQSSCGVVPSQKQMTLIIHNDADGRYSIAGQCATMAVLKHLKVGQ
jgi:hypothetical protein